MTTQIERDEKAKRRVSAAMKGVALPADLISRPKQPLGPYNAASIAPKDGDSKRRLSSTAFPLKTSVAAIPPPSQTTKGKPPSSPAKSKLSNAPSSRAYGKTQIEKDEDIKRRSRSVAMRPMEPFTKPNLPKQLVAPASRSPSPSKIHKVTITPARGRKTMPIPPYHSPQSVSPAKAPIGRNGDNKRRMSASLKPIEISMKPAPPQQLATPERSTSREPAFAVPFPKARMGTPERSNSDSRLLPQTMPSVGDLAPQLCRNNSYRQLGQRKHRISLPNASVLAAAATASRQHQSPIPPSPDKIIVPSPSSNTSREKVLSVPFPKARMGTPTRSNSESRIFPLMPSVNDLAPQLRSSPHRQLGQRKRRVSLPNALALAAPATASPAKHNMKHRLGERKQRVSLPPSTKIAAQAVTLADTRATQRQENQSHGGTANVPHQGAKHHRRLGDRKQRVSSLAREQTTEVPIKHRLGDRKHRPSLPPCLPSGHQNAIGGQQRPAETRVVANAEVQRHRQLGEKKSNRLSLPNAASAQVEAMQSRSHSDSSLYNNKGTEEEEKEEVSGTNSCEWSSSSQEPKSGVDQNGGQPYVGPGAFFVPFVPEPDDATTEDQDIERQSSHRSLSVVPFVPEPDDATTEDQDIERQSSYRSPSEATASTAMHGSSTELMRLDSKVSSTKAEDIDVEKGPEPPVEDPEIRLDPQNSMRSAFSFRPPERIKRIGSSRRSVERVKSTRAADDEDDEPKKKRLCNAPWWCNVVVPLFIAAFVGAVITGVVTSIQKEDASTGNPNVEASAPPIVQLFEDESLAPSFTLTALEDPNSPQSKAKNWLLADPMASGYTQARKLQRFALATLWYSAKGGRWQNATDWLSYDHHECLWYSARAQSVAGIQRRNKKGNATTMKDAMALTCNEEQEYEHLLLSGTLLRGSLPAEISFLTSLVQISLHKNKLYSSIPSELGTLTKLTDLGLSENELEGSIPTQVGQLSGQLEMLYLRDNKLEGPVPTQLSQLTRLKDLHFTNNALTSTIPTVLAELDQLRTLRLGGNKLIGPIPTQIGKLVKLTLLNVGVNQLTGAIPSEIASLSSLAFFGLASNSLDSTIPTELARLKNLETLLAASSGLRGSIPEQLGEMTRLGALSLAGNRLTGTVASELGRLSALEALYLYANRFTGELPSELGSIGRLSILHAFVNQLSSTIPSELGNLTELRELHLFETGLSGEVPTELGNLLHLEEFFITNTELSGGFQDTTCSLVASKQLTIKADCSQMFCCKA